MVPNGSGISCAAQRRQRCAQQLPGYAARRQSATIEATLGRVSCMRLLGGDPMRSTRVATTCLAEVLEQERLGQALAFLRERD